MATVTWHLAPEITRHLSKIEQVLWLTGQLDALKPYTVSDFSELSWRLPLLEYCHDIGIPERILVPAVIKSAPLALIQTHLFKSIMRRTLTFTYFDVITLIIQHHRPVAILAEVIGMIPMMPIDVRASAYCSLAAKANNKPALDWLRDPNTGFGRYHWSEWTCYNAAKHGHLAMLQDLRNPNTNGGMCCWKSETCEIASEYGHLAILQWLRNPNKTGGACPWCKPYCRDLAIDSGHLDVVAWIDTQPDDD